MKTTTTTALLLTLLTAASASPTTPFPPDYCPVAQCSPHPTHNKCDITTSCIQTSPTGQFHCACRAGYKAAAQDGDTGVHYRTLFAGQEYRVFVKPGVECNTLCKEYWLGPKSCAEVQVLSQCS